MATTDYLQELRSKYMLGTEDMFLNSNYGFFESDSLFNDLDDTDDESDGSEEGELSKSDKKAQRRIRRGLKKASRNLKNKDSSGISISDDAIMDGLKFAGTLINKQDGSQSDSARAGNVMNSAMQGAKFGSNFGPIGTGIGAAAGGLISFVQGSNAKKKRLRELNEKYENDVNMAEANREMMYSGTVENDRLVKARNNGKHQLNYG